MTHTNYYKIEGPAVVNFSGGRSSGYMLHQILDAHNGKLPHNVIPIFCNTGKEKPETLDFVHKCGQEWNVEIKWLEYEYKNDARGGVLDPKNTYKIVGHNSASRNGEPFSQLIAAKNYLPNSVTRICTEELKINTTFRYMKREHGLNKMQYISVLGIRHDERKRWTKIMNENRDCRQKNRTILPMVLSMDNIGNVSSFWRENHFDLLIESNRGNCDLCFLKGKNILVDIMRENPDIADWWIRQEERISKINLEKQTLIEHATFRKDRSYKYLQELSQQPKDLSLFDYAEEKGLDCFCTD